MSKHNLTELRGEATALGELAERTEADIARLKHEHRVSTTFEYPPIPIRQFDWLASYEDDEGQPCGHGRTEAEAVADLLESYPRESREYQHGYRDGIDGRLRPYELGSSIAAFNWHDYDEGRKAGEKQRKPFVPAHWTDNAYETFTGSDGKTYAIFAGGYVGDYRLHDETGEISEFNSIDDAKRYARMQWGGGA